MGPPDLLTERWYRLFVGVVCAVLGAIGALMVASSVRLEGTGTAHDWFLFCSMFCGFALGFPGGAALYTHSTAITSRVRLPRARLLRPRPR
jgi:hypothetical protein